MPKTPASAIAGCVRRTAPRSAGATWKPETLISSYHVLVSRRGTLKEGGFHFKPIHNPEPPSLIAYSYVSSLQPASLQHRLCGRSLVLPMTETDMRPSYQYFPSLARDHSGSILIDELDDVFGEPLVSVFVVHHHLWTSFQARWPTSQARRPTSSPPPGNFPKREYLFR